MSNRFEVLYTLFLLLGMYFSANGVILGTYFLVGLVFLHMFSVVFTSVVFLFAKDVPLENDLRMIGIRLIIQCFIALVAYHLYTLGFVMLSGSVAVTLVIAFFSNILSFDGSEEDT